MVKFDFYADHQNILPIISVSNFLIGVLLLPEKCSEVPRNKEATENAKLQ